MLSPAAYRFLAEAVVAFHFAFVLFVVLGGLLVLRWRQVAWLHLPAAAWGALISFAGWVCPLTPLENRFRRLGLEAGYRTGFIEHYITGILYPQGLTRGIQVALGAFVVVVTVLVYWRAFSRPPATRRAG